MWAHFTDIASMLEALVSQHPFVVLTILMAGAIIEYLFPPFPGDMLSFAGALLVSVHGRDFLPVFTAVTLGSVCGAALDFKIGVWWHRHRKRRHSDESADRLSQLVKAFRKHGEVYLALNRFIPGIRGLFFVAAGLAEMRLGRVLLYATVSAALWNLALMGGAYAIGGQIDEAHELFATLGWLGWFGLGGLVLTLGFSLWQRNPKA